MNDASPIYLTTTAFTCFEAGQVVAQKGGDEQREVTNELLHLRIAALVHQRHVWSQKSQIKGKHFNKNQALISKATAKQ